jgi:MFS family permease
LGPLVANQFGDGSTAYLKRAILGGYGSYIIAWLIIGGAPWLPLAMVGSLLRGMGGSVNWTYSSVILQRSTPDQYMGRVFGLDFTFFTLGMAISVWFTGVAVDAFSLSPREVVFWLALLCVIPFILWGIYLRKTPLETQPEAV